MAGSRGIEPLGARLGGSAEPITPRCFWRRRRDSNPRFLAFQASVLARLDHCASAAAPATTGVVSIVSQICERVYDFCSGSGLTVFVYGKTLQSVYKDSQYCQVLSVSHFTELESTTLPFASQESVGARPQRGASSAVPPPCIERLCFAAGLAELSLLRGWGSGDSVHRLGLGLCAGGTHRLCRAETAFHGVPPARFIRLIRGISMARITSPNPRPDSAP